MDVAAKRYRLQHVRFKQSFHAGVVAMPASDSSVRFIVEDDMSCWSFKRTFHTGDSSGRFMQVVCYCK